MPDAVIVANASQERIVLWNMGAATMFGYSSQEALGLPLHSLVPPELRDTHRSAIAHYARTGEGAVIDSDSAVEVEALRSDGTRVPVELRLSPIDNPEGVEGRHVLGILRDVTDRKAAEDYRLRLAVRDTRRADALEIHDDVLQQLVLAQMAFDLGDTPQARKAVTAALETARRIVAARLEELVDEDNTIAPGALRRSRTGG